MKFARPALSPVVGACLQAILRRGRLRTPLRASALLPLAFASAMAQPMPPPEVPDTLDLHTAIRFALENNFAIRQAKERIRQQEGVVVEVTAREIPNLGAAGTYQLNEREISQTVPASDRSWQINVTATQVLFAGGGVRSTVKSARYARDAAVLDLKATINDALLQVRTAFYGLLLAREKIKVQE